MYKKTPNHVIVQGNSLCIREEDNNKDVDVRNEFLKQFEDCCLDSILSMLPLEHGDNDHKIDPIPGSVPPNQSPYRVSRVQ